jgi:hypothetical protein
VIKNAEMFGEIVLSKYHKGSVGAWAYGYDPEGE